MSARGSLVAYLPGPPSQSKIALPALNNWKVHDMLVERTVGYDDTGVAWVGEFLCFSTPVTA